MFPMRFALLFFVLLCSFAPAAGATDSLTKAQIGQTLDCGYVSYPPALVKDAKTGEWNGFDRDFIADIVRRLKAGYAYKYESNWGTVPEDLKTGKYDVLCSTYWISSEKAKFVLFTRPLYYQPIFIVTRANDTRFDKDLSKLNDPKVTMVALEGDVPVGVIQNDYPKAKLMTLPGVTSKYSDTMLWVADGKADAGIMDVSEFYNYNKNNPGKLKLTALDKPVRLFPVSFVLKQSDVALWHAFNMAIEEMQLDGTLERIMRKYIHAPHAFYPIGRDGKYIVVDKVAQKK